MIYFFSDAHFGHRNICKGTSKWTDLSRCRNFNTIEEMNNAIVKSINKIVGKDDILYHIGDWSFGGWENIWNFRKQIVCENIIQINGNHDKHIIEDKFFPHLEKQEGFIYELENKNDYRIFEKIKSIYDVTAHDLFKKVYNDTLRIVIDGQVIILDHYPYEIWPDMDDGAWHLHGHTHHNIDDTETSIRYKRMDVGWDGKVYSFDEIKKIMSKREARLRHN